MKSVSTKMTEQIANPIEAESRQNTRDLAGYLYQGATIVAALLLVLSAAV